MAYKGPQEFAQSLTPSANNGNPGGVYNVDMNKNFGRRYTPPTVDSNGRVTNYDQMNYDLPFNNVYELMGIGPGINPNSYLSNMFGAGSMVPPARGMDPLNRQLQGRANSQPPNGTPYFGEVPQEVLSRIDPRTGLPVGQAGPGRTPAPMPAPAPDPTMSLGGAPMGGTGPVRTPAPTEPAPAIGGTSAGGYKPAWAEPGNQAPAPARPGAAPGVDFDVNQVNPGVPAAPIPAPQPRGELSQERMELLEMLQRRGGSRGPLRGGRLANLPLLPGGG